MTALAVDPRRRTGEPLPVGFGVVVDAGTHEVADGVWAGGQPLRVVRLSPAGRQAWETLSAGSPVSDRLTGVVARRLTDAGLAHPVPPPTGSAAELTVVVPVRDRVAELDRCLRALGPIPVVVVDDASNDGSAIARVALAHGGRVVRLDVNAGPAAARMAGLACVQTEVVAFVDSDTEPTADALDELAGHLADPLVGAVAPRIRGPRRASAAARFTYARGSLDMGPVPGRVAAYSTVPYVPSAVLVARAAAVREVGGFDAALRYGEDVDLVWRLVGAGHRVRYAPDICVTHHDPVTWHALLARRFRYGTSAAPLATRHPGRLAPFIVQPWYLGAVAALLIRRPALAAAAASGAYLTTRRAVTARGLPPSSVRLRHVAQGVTQTGLGLARCATRFAAPALVVALARRPTRLPAAALLLGPALTEWSQRRPALDPVRYAAAALADDCAYGAGVIAGCLSTRTLAPLVPIRARRLAG